MKISTKLRYSSRLLLYLAEHEGIVRTSELGENLKISPLYLRPIAIELEKNGIIKSYRGARGGYELARSPEEITMLQIAQLYENLNLVPCLENPDYCPFSDKCKTRKLWMKLKGCIEELLENTTLKDVKEERV